MNKVEKAIKKAEDGLDCEDKIEITIFKRKHFKKELSTTHGVGFQDLKKKPRAIVDGLICNGFNLSIEPLNMNSSSDFELAVYVTK